MTEQEAKTKWCPFARAQTQDTETAPAVNRTLQGGIDIGCHCIGSACMAWRTTGFRTEGVTYETPSALFALDSGNAPGDHLITGYCGLGGKP